jgi:hypothetical protein
MGTPWPVRSARSRYGSLGRIKSPFQDRYNMSENSTGKQIAITVGAGIIAYALWEGMLKELWFDWLDNGKLDGSAGAGGAGAGSAGGSGSGTGTGGAGGSGSGAGAGGAGGAGGGGVTDYSSLAAAIMALAAGVQLPNIQSKSMTMASGTNELLAGEGGKRICVLSYAVFASGAIATAFRDGNATTNLWNVPLSAPAGISGANVATSWPGYLFATSPGNALKVQTDGASVVSVTYWQENA